MFYICDPKQLYIYRSKFFHLIESIQSNRKHRLFWSESIKFQVKWGFSTSRGNGCCSGLSSNWSFYKLGLALGTAAQGSESAQSPQSHHLCLSAPRLTNCVCLLMCVHVHASAQAGVVTGDRVWRMPLFQHYTRQVTDSQLADLNNVGKYSRYVSGEPVRSCSACFS